MGVIDISGGIFIYLDLDLDIYVIFLIRAARYGQKLILQLV